MPIGDFPLLFFPAPALTSRNTLGGGGTPLHFPSIARQRARISPQLQVLQRAFEAKRMKLQQNAPMENPELILVVEIANSIEEFSSAVARIPGLEWLVEWAKENIPPDEDFFVPGRDEKPFSGRLFLLASNQEALTQLLALWDRYQKNPEAKFNRGLNKFRNLFTQLRNIRYWSVADRINHDVQNYWRNCIDSGLQLIRFEIEAWYFGSQQKNAAVVEEIQGLVHALGGVVRRRTLIDEIAYHGFLVELPTAAVTSILEGELPELVLSDRVMFFRPKAQSVTDGVSEAGDFPAVEIAGDAVKPPLIALLDGLPLENHSHLQNRLIVDDPDGWDVGYEAKDRVHGTAMASLILHGELDGNPVSSDRRLYVRPILRPDLNDVFNSRRREHTPDDVLLIDLIHRAVKRICEGEGGEGAVAPSVRVINLSICDGERMFGQEMSPWARLLDWLSFRYSVLFIVSAGNYTGEISLNVPSDALNGFTAEQRAAMAFTAMIAESTGRRLLAPAEALNVLTVGALHADQSTPPELPGRYDLFSAGGLSSLSRIGHGYRRAIKPEILLPGGRVLYAARMIPHPEISTLDIVRAGVAPGHRVAAPPLPGQSMGETVYTRGTSNAAALASRAATQIYEMLEELRAETDAGPAASYDAVVLKALLVHGANWGDWPDRLLAERPDFDEITNATARRTAQKDFLTRWLGYGPVNVERAINCSEERATLIGVGEIGAEEALVFSAPLPPTLAGKVAWRRLTVTLAWMSPINCSHQGYRRAKLWVTPPQTQLSIKRENSVHDKAALRGTVQHEILEGEDAVVFVDGDKFECKVNCVADAGVLVGKVRFAICVSLEVSEGVGIPVYQEISERINVPVEIQAAV